MLPKSQNVFTDITPEYLANLSMSDLCDMLSVRTRDLIQEMAQRNPDRTRLGTLRSEVERIQKAYEERRERQ